MRSKKKWMILIILVILVYVSLRFIKKEKVDSDLSNYLQGVSVFNHYAKDVMPDLDELSKYEQITYQHYEVSNVFDKTETILLVVKYDQATYEIEKVKVDADNFYIREAGYFYNREGEIAPPVEDFSMGKYHFDLVYGNKGDYTLYPKSFGIIGTSDELNSIAYLYFYGPSHYSYEDTMQQFMKKYFKYDFK